MNTNTIEGKTVFITGGNAGIGLATAELFATQGANTAIFSRRSDKNAEAVEKIRSNGGEIIGFSGDITDEQCVREAIKDTFERYGSLHYAFNNAGLEEPYAELPDHTVEMFRQIVDVNMLGVWLCMREQAPLIEQSGGGCIVNTGSIASVVGVSNSSLYVGAKHAVVGMSKSVALEYASRGVRVNIVSPAVTKTSLYERYLDSAEDRATMQEMLENNHPIGRVAEPAEIAQAVLYLCRDATFTTGHNLLCDGGFTAR